MKKSYECYAKQYLTHKQSQSKQKQHNFNYFSNKNENQPRILNKRNGSKVKTNSQSLLKKEQKKNSSPNELILKSTMVCNDSQGIISSYDKAIITLFSNLKEVLDESNYKEIKKKFFLDLERNFLQSKKRNDKTSTLSSSNSILSLLQESKNKYSMQQRQTSFASRHCKRNETQHGSLYSLSKPGKKVNSNSPVKTSMNSTFLPNYYSFKKFSNSSTQKENDLLFKRVKGQNNLSNISTGNVVKEIKSSKKEINNEENITSLLKQNNTTGNIDLTNDSGDILSKIKNSLDDNLKGFFEFSYENFLNKESERDCTRRTLEPNE